ncbi:MAG TPA: hypothetical protein VGX95_18340 [Xanthobacteraceae bacterium]|jgi:hypothetical protein|nr:hypothetical protein [Xanthobacteraceae bacterium]
MRTGVCVWLAAALAAGLPLAAHAQHFPPPIDEPAPAAQPVPPEQPPAKAPKKKKAARPAAPEAPPPVVNLPVDPDGMPPPTEAAPAAAPAHAKAAAPSHAVACGGAFAKNSSHIRLAQIFGTQNITFTEVDGPQSSKIPATVLYPKDPKLHLEVVWKNEAGRAGTSLVVITGQSTWTGPKGLHLGLPLAALEKLNGKPFQLAGFDQDNAGAVLDWQGGALDKVPGGCKVGLRLAPDAKASAEARAAAAGQTLMSNDAVVRAVNPKVAEIIIGY